MKSILLSSVAVAVLVFTGCGSNQPAVDKKPVENVAEQEVEVVQTETVSPENSEVLDFNGMSINQVEQKLSTVYFDFDKYNIRADMQDAVQNDAEVANKVASRFKVKLEGNCDEWGSDEYNFALGLKRASSVKKALVAQGVDATNITMVSYGESNPVCTAQTQECWSKNRRVDFKLLP